MVICDDGETSSTSWSSYELKSLLDACDENPWPDGMDEMVREECVDDETKSNLAQ